MLTLTSAKKFDPFCIKSKHEEELDLAIQRVYAVIEIRAVSAKIDLGIFNDQSVGQPEPGDQYDSMKPRSDLIEEAVTGCLEILESKYRHVYLEEEELATLSEHPDWPRVVKRFVYKQETLHSGKTEEARWRVNPHTGTSHYYKDFENYKYGEMMNSACGLYAKKTHKMTLARTQHHRCGNCARIV